MPEQQPTGEVADRGVKARQLVREYVRRGGAGTSTDRARLLEAHSELMPELGKELGKLDLIDSARRVAESRNGEGDSAPGTSEEEDPRLEELPPGFFPGLEIHHRANHGGQGVIYRATQKATGRDVAVKVMHEGPFVGVRGKARFEREVRILAQLKHPNIVTIHDSGSVAGSLYFVMDWVAGEPLDTYAATRESSVNETLKLFVKICEAVNAAHLRGIIHRDLKPSNILVDESGEPQILDFGLAKTDTDEMGDATHWRSMTVTGQFVGSLPWASPEQAEGSPEQIDLRTDVYSLGVVLYQVLTGRFPYDVACTMREAMHNIVEAEPTKPSAIRKDINDEVETIALKCLAKNPDRRYQSAGDLARDIRRYLADEPIEAKRESTLYIVRKHLHRYRVSLCVTGAFLVLTLAFSVVGWRLYAQSQGRLWQSLVAEARSRRSTGEIGQRTESLRAIAEAAAVRVTPELRDDAIEAMALADLRIVQSWECDPKWKKVSFDSTLGRYVLMAQDGELSIRATDDHRELWHAPSEPAGPVTVRRLEIDPTDRFVLRSCFSMFEFFELDTGRSIRRMPAPEPQTNLSGFAFSSSGDELVALPADGAIRIHDVFSESSRVLARLPESFLKSYRRARYHPQDRLLLVDSASSHSALVYDATTGALVHSLDHSGGVWAGEWSPNGDLIATGSENDVALWDSGTGSVRFVLRDHSNTPTGLRFSHDGVVLASYSWDGTSRLWDTRTGRRLLSFRKLAYRFAADGYRAVGDFRGSDRVGSNLRWQLADVLYHREFKTLVGRKRYATEKTDNLAMHPLGRVVATLRKDFVRFWDLDAATELAVLPIRSPIGFHSKTGDLLHRGDNGLVFARSVKQESGRLLIGSPRVVAEDLPRAESAALGPNGDRLLLIHKQGRLTLLDLSGSADPRTVTLPASIDGPVRFDPLCRWFATLTESTITVRSLTNADHVADFQTPGSKTVAFSPDGRWLVSSAGNEQIVWATDTWEPKFRLAQRGPGRLGQIAFSPDVRVVALPGLDSMITLVDLERGEVICRLKPPNPMPRVKGIVFDPSGRRLIFAGNVGNMLFVWDLPPIRKRLREMNLDWDLPSYPPALPAAVTKPLRVEVDLGELAPQSTVEATQQ